MQNQDEINTMTETMKTVASNIELFFNLGAGIVKPTVDINATPEPANSFAEWLDQTTGSLPEAEGFGEWLDRNGDAV